MDATGFSISCIPLVMGLLFMLVWVMPTWVFVPLFAAYLYWALKDVG
jgi:hypothetical protein